MNNTVLKFFNKYQKLCEKKWGIVHIPKPDPKNGMPGKNITLMFINERPGRIGPGKSDRISFENNDPTAHRFRNLFEKLGISRKRIFITNACIYYPIRKNYRDTRPNKKEIDFSAPILEDQINRVSPKIILPLGNTALRTLKKIFPELRRITLKNHVAKMITATSYKIFPLYHTSKLAEITRKEKEQKNDWEILKKLIFKNL